ncbi:hypothetical protein CDL12_10848 [Handroanthus impetiginosus]|uniref:Uncharacterized protein n=1 Tax=Handroanthus impetiginosus TaxID=429701 RepID=A0A2G9HG64_9LAMI|nr:hypothetical protein CDL12_10848 [Handroanthus impetiginosus]
MAVEVFPDSPTVVISPRISFSHDLSQNDVVPVEQYIPSSSSSDFDFCVFRNSFDLDQSSSADELFSDGKILPIQIKKRLPPPPKPAAPPPQPPVSPPPPQIEGKQSCKSSFWRFKRSTSLNDGESGYARTLCPIPLLSRSNSTGSASSSVKRSNNQKQNFMKYSSPNSSLKQPSHQKPPLKKIGHNGVKINPVLNVPPANLFGFGFIFSSGKKK